MSVAAIFGSIRPMETVPREKSGALRREVYSARGFSCSASRLWRGSSKARRNMGRCTMVFRKHMAGDRMLATDKRLGKHRVEFFDRLTQREVHDLATNPNLRILQTARPVSARTWELLNQNLFALRPEIELRVYGFYSSTCDLSFVKGMSNVRRFSADCLVMAAGIEHLAALENLEELHVGVFSLQDFDFLSSLPSGLKSLTLSPTKSKKPRLNA